MLIRVLAFILVVLHTACALALLLHTLLQLSLLRSFMRWRAQSKSCGEATPTLNPDMATWPFVTVQLPLYNEKYVVERLIDYAARLRYPREKLEIQVLDDSTDETSELAAARVRLYRAEGLRIHLIHRPHRSGFKAGALRQGLQIATGDLVTVFDADFLPHPDFLLYTIPHFEDARVGLVQARWGHINREESLLTRIQALMLDAHFTIEQRGRSQQSCFINFNGTAGIWRAAAIFDAGNWSADTLTEDVDLSYRAQLAGWRFVFLDHVIMPAELPRHLSSFRSQQFRWMKGLAQNAVRLLPRILRANLTLRVKMHACGHLLESALYVPILALIILTPLLEFLHTQGALGAWPFFHPALLVSGITLPVIYYVSQGERYSGLRGLLSFVMVWTVFFITTLGLAAHNVIAVMSGFTGQPGEFIRTPKHNSGDERARDNVYLNNKMDQGTALAFLVWIYLLGVLCWSALSGKLTHMWLPIAAFIGFTSVLTSSVFHAVTYPRRENPSL
jgi:cellulose synthase/poly-beta-1,6-N-acetylglucosamine synthase-like glycosyltransferase